MSESAVFPPKKKANGPLTDLSAIKRIQSILSQLKPGAATRVLNFVAEGFHEKRMAEHQGTLAQLSKSFPSVPNHPTDAD